MTEEDVHLFWNLASKSRGEGKPISNKEEKTELWYVNINI